MQIITAYQSL